MQELVKQHGGTIDVESVLGAGSAFIVNVPLGREHLPAERLATARALTSTAVGAHAFIEEALRWLPDAPAPQPVEVARDDSPCILVADDNADMRAYIKRLLGGRWRVEVVGNGVEALSFLRRRPADLVIADVMMPTLDGFGLLRELRADARTRDIPVLMLSARAGEESRIEGLQAGANDYLVKPFSARELIARVESQLLRVEVHAIETAHNRRLATIFAHAPVAIALLKGPQHVIEFANESYSTLVAHRPLIGKTVREAFPELENQGIYELLDSVYSSGLPFLADSLRIRLNRGPDGAPEDAFFKFVYQPMLNAAGGVDGIAIVATDVTDLSNARREAEAANRAKDEFLAMLGHELRNPLAPILTALQLMSLRDGADATEKERAVIDRQVRHLVRLVDDLLDVSRIARGRIELAREHVELCDDRRPGDRDGQPAAGGAPPQLDRPCAAQRVGRQWRRHPPVAGRAEPADQRRQVHRARRPHRRQREPARHDARIARDGQRRRHLGRDAADRVRCVRAEPANGRPITGRARPRTGDRADHGGAARRKRRGTQRGGRPRQRIHHPAAGGAGVGRREKPTDVHRRATRSVETVRALVVDDNPDAVSMLGDALRTFGYETRTASDGLAALAIAESFHPHVVLLDLGLPVMDGHEVAERLRALDSPPLTVAVTGYGQEADRARSAAAGFAAHFVKPVDLEELKTYAGSRC